MSASARTRFQTSRRRRIISLGLALGLELLLVLVLLGLGTGRRVTVDKNGALTVSLIPNVSETPTPVMSRRQMPRAAEATPAPASPVAPPPPVVKLPRPANQPELPILVLSKDELAAADISKLGTRGAPAGSGDGDRVVSTAGDSEAVGTGPNGQPLYNAEWVRRPSNRELAGYLPAKMPEGGGWGLIACRTAAGYRVEDCIELGNSPPGSHLASAVRQAAWQFRVRPPRKGGRDMVGEWVRIRIDYSQGAAD
jgi:protein TonB